MSWFSDLFKSGGGQTVTAEPLLPGFQLNTGQDLSNFVQKYLKLFNPGAAYEGQLSAPMTGLEGMGLDQLGDVLGGPTTGALYDSAKGQVLDTLGGRYADPSQSPFIRSMIDLAKQNLGDAITDARGRRGARGTYFTRAGIQEESRLSERTQNYLNSVIGQFMNAERGRQADAVPQAQALEQYGLSAPLQKIAASQSLGSLERTLSQADFERQYADWRRGREELGAVPQTGLSLYGSSVPYGVKSLTAPKTPSPFQSWFSGMDWAGMLQGGGPTGNPNSTGGGSGGWMDAALKALPYLLAAV